MTTGAPPGMQRYQLETGFAQMTPAERASRGNQARAAVPRDSHAAFEPPPAVGHHGGDGRVDQRVQDGTCDTRDDGPAASDAAV